MLIRILEVIGMNILKVPLSMMISPGSLPGKGNLGANNMINPATSKITPEINRIFAIFKNIKRAIDAWVTWEICF